MITLLKKKFIFTLYVYLLEEEIISTKNNMDELNNDKTVRSVRETIRDNHFGRYRRHLDVKLRVSTVTM